ncbi:nicotinate-nucleotide adenylyltransferase [Cellvibrio sp. PSBB023]|uniref:nicotinate-nucleotide adenylyltransferase n=1 Tax=Cellvibrio sp. PSBB023 TaxID=1945512 RepID=UPI00098F00C8|nr:nicotinate-nucleotide adenylyltransferase [Cellvibrio sp. PSBB023]AQT62068.1 nicotinic acid mononucleotide adenylyltransferase [Cellvibrio sp. PSBB023]
MRKCLGIFGGTFDPIHLGHLRLALELKQQFSLDEMHLLPCYLPPHRAAPGATANQRVAMLRLALQDCPQLQLDTRELQRDRPSYTVDTLTELRAQLGEQVSLSLCMGMDSFCTLDSWHEWSQLIRLAHIVVVERPGYELPVVGPVADLLRRHRAGADAIQAAAAGAVIIAAPRLLPISATEIRAQIKSGQSPQFLLPDAVLNYIHAQQLYCE